MSSCALRDKPLGANRFPLRGNALRFSILTACRRPELGFRRGSASVISDRRNDAKPRKGGNFPPDCYRASIFRLVVPATTLAGIGVWNSLTRNRVFGYGQASSPRAISVCPAWARAPAEILVPLPKCWGVLPLISPRPAPPTGGVSMHKRRQWEDGGSLAVELIEIANRRDLNERWPRARRTRPNSSFL
jgi:hypothetical protein